MKIEEADAVIEISWVTPEGIDRKPREHGGGASNVTACRESLWTEVDMRLMEEVVSHGNMMAAYERVASKKGAPGVDGMQGCDLKGYLQKERPFIKEELLNEAYHPPPVRKVGIHKHSGGMCMLGIPTRCGSPTSDWRKLGASPRNSMAGSGGSCAAFCGDSGSAPSTGPEI